jgi:hypothetical protein
MRKLAAIRRQQALMRSARMEMISRWAVCAKFDHATAGCNTASPYFRGWASNNSQRGNEIRRTAYSGRRETPRPIIAAAAPDAAGVSELLTKLPFREIATTLARVLHRIA